MLLMACHMGKGSQHFSTSAIKASVFQCVKTIPLFKYMYVIKLQKENIKIKFSSCVVCLQFCQ